MRLEACPSTSFPLTSYGWWRLISARRELDEEGRELHDGSTRDARLPVSRLNSFALTVLVRSSLA